MKISAISAKELTCDLKEKWALVQGGAPDFESPCFCHEFTASLASHRNDIYVGLMEDAGDIVGFFPYKLGRFSIAIPLNMCDYQGVIVRQGVRWRVEDLLKGCSLAAWDFDQLIFSQTGLQQGAGLVVSDSMTISIPNGYNAYLEGLLSERSERLEGFFRKTRKLEREVGRVTFQQDVRDISVLRKLMEWKAAKYNKGRAFEAWALKTFETIFDTRNRNFQGVLSALYAGKELVAAHFGMRSGRILHWWFPTYNAAFAKYSPGALLLLKMAEAFSPDGVNLIDLGPGGEDYKTQFSNDAIKVARGSFEIASFTTSARRFSKKAKNAARKIRDVFTCRA